MRLSRSAFGKLAGERGIALFILATTFFVYQSCLGFEFVLWDDDIHIYGNQLMHDPGWAGVRELLTKPYFGLYIPVPYLFWLGLAKISIWQHGSLEPAIFHAANLLLHATNAMLVVRLLRRVALPPLGAAWIGVVIFLLHPLQVEAVAWVSGAKDLISTMLSLLALLSLFPSRAPLSWRRQLMAAIFFALAILSKPSAVILPLVLMALGFLHRDRDPAWIKRALLPAATWSLLAVPVIHLTRQLQAEDIANLAPLAWYQRVPLVFDAVGFYAGKLLWPSPLLVDYGRTPAVVLQDTSGWALAGAVLLALLAASLWRLPRWRPLAVAFGIVIFGILPVSGIVPFAYQNISTVADRYMYFSMLGVSIMVALGVSRWQGWLLATLGATSACVLAYGTGQQVSVFRNTRTLFSHVLVHNDKSFSGHNNLGVVLMQLGKTEEALAHLKQAAALRPSSYKTLDNIGVGLQKLAKLDQAMQYHQQALALEPNYGTAYANLGEALRQASRGSEARAVFEQGIAHDPSHYLIRINYGVLLEQGGDHITAEQQYLQALPLSSDRFLAYFNLGVLYEKTQRFDQAARAYAEALKLRPGSPDVIAAVTRAEARKAGSQK